MKAMLATPLTERRTKMIEMPKFMTIRETARTGIMSEHHLRIMLKQGRLPGIFTGNTFKVNYNMLIDQLNSESKIKITE